MIGQKLGSYKIIEELGSGGMGKVYAAEHMMIGRRAAIKVLLSRYSKDKPILDRFFREARAAAQIKHSGIVDIFDYGYTDDGRAYIMMELLEGESLTTRIRSRGRVSDEETLRLSRQMANALVAAHAESIVHRDLKPDNVFIVPDAEVLGGERVKLLDFGIAKVTDELGNSVSQTSTGMILGSPLYMSPEQCLGDKEVDHRADIYSLGCVMYHMICGRPPFTGAGSGKIIALHIYENPKEPSVLVPDVRPDVEAIIMRSLAKDPHDRYADMARLEQALIQAGAASFSAVHENPYARSYSQGIPPTRKLTQSSDGMSARMPGGSPATDSAPYPLGAISTLKSAAGIPNASASASYDAPAPGVMPSGHYASPTTLGSVASQIKGGPSRKRGLGKLWLALALVTLAIGGGFAAWQLSDDGSASVAEAETDAGPSAALEPERPTPIEPEPMAIDAGAVAAAQPPDAAVEATDEPILPPPVKTVTLRIITTKPKRAFVRDAELNLLGETPLELSVPKNREKLIFKISRDGYRTETVTLVPKRNQTKRLKLRKARRANPGSANRPPARPPDPSNSGSGDDDDDDDDDDDGNDFGTTIDPFAE